MQYAKESFLDRVEIIPPLLVLPHVYPTLGTLNTSRKGCTLFARHPILFLSNEASHEGPDSYS